jgi:hypothetical protein
VEDGAPHLGVGVVRHREHAVPGLYEILLDRAGTELAERAAANARVGVARQREEIVSGDPILASPQSSSAKSRSLLVRSSASGSRTR